MVLTGDKHWVNTVLAMDKDSTLNSTLIRIQVKNFKKSESEFVCIEKELQSYNYNKKYNMPVN